MGFNIRMIIRIIAIVMAITASMMILPMAVSLIYREKTAIIGFLFSIIPVLVISFLIIRFIKLRSNHIRIRDGFLIVGLSWVFSSLCGALPFMISKNIPNFFDAFFESASGFSTTGASVLYEIEGLTKGLLFWRSATHWLGGIGLLVFTMALLPSLGIGMYRTREAENSGQTLDNLTPRIYLAKLVFTIYIGMTIIETILLLIGDMNLYDALIHTFGTVATGGFSSYNTGIAHFNSLYIEIVITFFMIMAGINFNLYFLLFRGNWKDVYRNAELKGYILFIFSTAVTLSIILFTFNIYDSIGKSIRYAVFQTVSIITTTGFVSSDFNIWPTPCIFILLTLMFFGGCSGSTSGSVKMIRILVFFKLIGRGIYKRLHPTAVVPVKLGGKNLSSDTVSSIASFIFLYIVLFIISTLIISLNNVDLTTAASTAAACLGNIGPGLQLVGPMANYGFYPWHTKFFLSLLMIIGRLELFAFILLMVPSFWQRGR